MCRVRCLAVLLKIIMIHFLSKNLSSKQATAIGLFAVALWSFVISLIRALSQHMGAVGGAAVMYSLSTVLIWLIFRPAAFA